MPGMRVVEIKGLAELIAKCNENRLYAAPGKRALQRMADRAGRMVRSTAPRGQTGQLRAQIFTKVNDRVPGPRWAVVGTKAAATPANPYTRGRRGKRKTKYPYPYPRRLEYDPQSKHKDWLQRAIDKAKGSFSGELAKAAKEIEAVWGSH